MNETTNNKIVCLLAKEKQQCDEITGDNEYRNSLYIQNPLNRIELHST